MTTQSIDLNAAITPVIKHQFLVPVKSIRYIFKDGKTASFIEGKYHTDVESEIAELNAEITAGHPVIYVDKDNVTIDMATLDPVNKIREQVRAELLIEMGISDQGGKLSGIGNTASLAEGSAAGSNSQA